MYVWDEVWHVLSVVSISKIGDDNDGRKRENGHRVIFECVFNSSRKRAPEKALIVEASVNELTDDATKTARRVHSSRFLHKSPGSGFGTPPAESRRAVLVPFNNVSIAEFLRVEAHREACPARRLCVI